MDKRFKAQEKRAKREERKNAPEPIVDSTVHDSAVDDDDQHDAEGVEN
ncbi:MAG: hypothetical protein ABI557_22010 [Aureliella sp.]